MVPGSDPPHSQLSTHQLTVRMGRAGLWMLAAVLVGLATGCEWREIQRANELPTCVQEQAEYPGDLFEALAQLEANLIDAGYLRDATKPAYRALLDSLYDARTGAHRSAGARPGLSRATACREISACEALTSPPLTVAYPVCYRQIARRHDLPDTSAWARQARVWSEFFQDGDFQKSYVLRSLDAVPPDRFSDIHFRSLYTQHALVAAGVTSHRQGVSFHPDASALRALPRFRLLNVGASYNRWASPGDRTFQR